VAGLTFSPDFRSQFAAIARVRWRIVVNSLRTIRGRLEMVSRVFVGVWFGLGGLGGAIAVAIACVYFTRRGHVEWTAFLLWPICVFWQMFPIVATAFTETFDSSNLLRFPLSYRSYFVVRLVYGSLDPATALGILWLTGMFVGLTVGNPRMFLAAGSVLLVFATANVLLGRMIFAWIERWLAQRRTREIMGILFFVLIIGLQFIGPLSARLGHHAHPDVTQFGSILLPLERALPPGLAASSIAQFSGGNTLGGLAALSLVAVYAASFFWLFHVRVLAQFRGESLSETTVAAARPLAEKLPVRPGWNVPFLSGPTAAVFQKEVLYLTRSGPMLFTLLMPIVILFIFRLTPSRMGSGSFMNGAPDLAFPVGAAYALLMLTNLIYNNFGADASGAQFWFVSPLRLRDVVRAKNLVHLSILAGELLLVWVMVGFLYRPPALVYTVATVAGVLFAAPANLAAGNLLSIYSPKKVDFGTFGRQRATNTTAFAALLVQAVVFGFIAVTFLAGRYFHDVWITAIVLVTLAVPAFAGYGLALGQMDRLALTRREALISELSRA
jgi:ABC-2 type transport system permease protein